VSKRSGWEYSTVNVHETELVGKLRF
jgi:hypothetical protein